MENQTDARVFIKVHHFCSMISFCIQAKPRFYEWSTGHWNIWCRVLATYRNLQSKTFNYIIPAKYLPAMYLIPVIAKYLIKILVHMKIYSANREINIARQTYLRKETNYSLLCEMSYGIGTFQTIEMVDKWLLFRRIFVWNFIIAYNYMVGFYKVAYKHSYDQK